MATINIGASNADDAFYRYKMPKLVAKIEGRGNGIKTNVVNNVEIAKALERSPEYVLKFFGCELGAQTNFDKTTGVSIVNGAHDAKKLSELLEGFIKRFVQCYSCGNPETTIKIKKELLHLKCKACGYVSDIDPRHKLNTFILKNPPENKMSKEEKKLKKAEEERLRDAEKAEKREKKEKEKEGKEKKEKKSKKDKKSKDSGEEGAEGADKDKDKDAEDESEEQEEEDDDGVVWMTDTSAEAAKRRAEEQLTAATAAMVTQGNIEAEEEAARKKAEREAKKKEEEEAKARAEEEAARLAAEAERLKLEEEAKAAHQAQVQGLRELLAEGKPAAVAAAVKALSAPNLAAKVAVLYEAVLGAAAPGEKLAEALKAQVAPLRALAQDPAGQLAQLVALEHFLAVLAPERAKETPLVLKAMYDLDLAEEDVILAWAGKADAAKVAGVAPEQAEPVRRAAAPFVDWLQEDEDEDEDDEEEDEE